MLGVKIDSKLNFKDHVSSILNKVDRKVTALIRLLRILKPNQKRVLMKSFIESQFNYCPLIWMFHGKEQNKKINRIQKRALRLTYMDFQSTFEELLVKDKNVSIHHKNIQHLAIEIFKIKNDVSNGILDEFFKDIIIYYNTRNPISFIQNIPNSDCFGKNSIKFFGPKIWNLIPEEYKNLKSLTAFKSKIKTSTPKNCICRLCT